MAHPCPYDALEQCNDPQSRTMSTSDGSDMNDVMAETLMTETTSGTDEAVAIIDRALSEMLHRELISTSEVADLLLDLRSLLVAEKVPVLVEG